MTSKRRRCTRGAANRVWLVFALALALVPPAAAGSRPRLTDLAHPSLARSVPAAGARLRTAPTELRLTFSEVPELTFTRLTLLGPAGDTVRLRPPAHAGGDAHTVVAAIDEKLPAGQFAVIWQTAGPDAHPIRGRYTFTVATDGTADTAGAGETGAGVVAPGQARPPAAHHPSNTVDTDGSTGSADLVVGPTPSWSRTPPAAPRRSASWAAVCF